MVNYKILYSHLLTIYIYFITVIENMKKALKRIQSEAYNILPLRGQKS